MKKLAIGLIAALTSLSIWAAPNEAEQKSAWDAADKAAIHGPSKTTVAGQSEINIPKGYAFIPKTQAGALMKAMGNGDSPNLQGLIVGEGDAFFTIDYTKDGYIKDDDAKELNADDILADYKSGTDAANQERTAKGFDAIEVAGWAQKPIYDEKQHRLTWAMIARDKGAAAGPDDGVNYETRILGREGVLSITWIGALSELNTTGKAAADSLTAQAQYLAGKKYEDYSASAGDKVAEYGLATLITGVAAKKLGLFAVIAAFLAKFAKVGIVLLIGGFAGFRKLFKKKEKAVVEPQTFNNEPPTAHTPSATNAAAKQDELTDTTKL